MSFESSMLPVFIFSFSLLACTGVFVALVVAANVDTYFAFLIATGGCLCIGLEYSFVKGRCKAYNSSDDNDENDNNEAKEATSNKKKKPPLLPPRAINCDLNIAIDLEDDDNCNNYETVSDFLAKSNRAYSVHIVSALLVGLTVGLDSSGGWSCVLSVAGCAGWVLVMLSPHDQHIDCTADSSSPPVATSSAAVATTSPPSIALAAPPSAPPLPLLPFARQRRDMVWCSSRAPFRLFVHVLGCTLCALSQLGFCVFHIVNGANNNNNNLTAFVVIHSLFAVLFGLQFIVSLIWRVFVYPSKRFMSIGLVFFMEQHMVVTALVIYFAHSVVSHFIDYSS